MCSHTSRAPSGRAASISTMRQACESRLAATAFAVHQFKQFFAENFIAEEVGQSDDGLLHRPDALHHIGALAHELAQFLVRRLHHFLHVRI